MKTINQIGIKGIAFVFMWLISQTAWAVNIERWHNADGSTTVWVPRHELPIVNIQIAFRGAGEVSGEINLAGATATLLVSGGTKEHTEEALRAYTTQQGFVLSSATTQEHATINLATLSRPSMLNAGVKLLNQILTEPRFDQAVLQREKNQAVSVLKQQESSPQFLAGRALTQLNYDQHPYAQSSRSNEQHIRAVNVEKIRQFHQNFYAKDNAVVSIVGDISREQAQNITQQLLQGLPAHAQTTDIVEVPVAQQGKTQHITLLNKEQTVVMLGVPLMVKQDPDRFALIVGNYILGAGVFDSRLMKTLRDQKGLVYGVSSSLSAYTQKGPFRITFSTKKDEAHHAIAAARQVLAEFIEQGPSEEELTQAKNYLLGSHPLRFDTNAKLLPFATSIGLQELPLDEFRHYAEGIKAVTAERVKEVWQRRVRLQELNQVSVGE